MQDTFHNTISVEDFLRNIRQNDALTQAMLDWLGIAEQVDIFCSMQEIDIEAAKDTMRIDAIIRIIQRFSKNVEDKIRNELKINDREIVNWWKQLRLTLVSAISKWLYITSKK